MNLTFIIAMVIFVYMLDISLLVWISSRFVGINPLKINQVGVVVFAILLFSWIAVSAFIYVPFIIKPFLILASGVIIIGFFITVLDTHFIKALLAGTLFILCQVSLTIFLLREFWNKHFFQGIKFMLFQYF